MKTGKELKEELEILKEEIEELSEKIQKQQEKIVKSIKIALLAIVFLITLILLNSL